MSLARYDFQVILAEDEEMFTELAVTALTSEGISEDNLRLAEDGLQALHHIDELQQQDPEAKILAFLDVRMPNLDGEETAKRLKERPQSLRRPFLVCCSANIESLCCNEPDDLFNMTMPKNFTDSEAVNACFAGAEAFFGSQSRSDNIDIIVADDEPICSVALAANISILGLEEPQSAEDPEMMEEFLQEAQSREGPLMLMVGKPDWLLRVKSLDLRRKPFVVDTSMERSGTCVHCHLQSQTTDEIQQAIETCRSWWQKGCP
ncbi:unnamed protein product [Effrenium voratum]|nr:unnamed protein product [Effrenium voratum]